MMFTLQTLVQRIMFRVYRQQLGPRLPGSSSHQFTRHHQSFLICECNSFSGFECPQCGRELIAPTVADTTQSASACVATSTKPVSPIRIRGRSRFSCEQARAQIEQPARLRRKQARADAGLPGRQEFPRCSPRRAQLRESSHCRVIRPLAACCNRSSRLIPELRSL